MRNILRETHTESQNYRFLRITFAASLAYHGLLGSVDSLIMHDNNMSGVPTKHLSSLVSCVTETVNISRVKGLDLLSVVQSIKSQELIIFKQRLGSKETQARIPRSKTNVKQANGHGHRSSQLDLISLFTQF